MNYSLIVRPKAESDVASAKAWYDGQRMGVGVEFVNCVEKALKEIRQTPLIFAINYRNIRCTVLDRFPYVIHYQVVRDCVFVFRVLHARRNLQA